MFQKLSKMLGLYKFAANATLKDGTEILIDGDLDIGVKVFVVTQDGDQPLPDGEYELGAPYEGNIIIIENGQISDVLEPEAPAEEAPVDETDDENKELAEEDEKTLEYEALDERITKLEEIVSELLISQEDLKKENDDLKSSNETLKKENTEFSSEINTFKEKLEKMNGAEPLKKKKVEITDEFLSSSTRLQAIKSLRNKK